ncbi:MAG: endonuclease [Gemmatimonadetes bacterium]|nr:endonuclease [Gemmatimonadota bacterium]MYG23870.1 endonuclease [Gemmatimonadota bacterium]MYJ38702.1 endonuclease [Gemmatimonadota bacterium]
MAGQQRHGWSVRVDSPRGRCHPGSRARELPRRTARVRAGTGTHARDWWGAACGWSGRRSRPGRVGRRRRLGFRLSALALSLRTGAPVAQPGPRRDRTADTRTGVTLGRLLLLPLAVTACGGGSPAAPIPGPEPEPDPLPQPIAIPAQGTAATLDLATWNLLNFGSTGQGPRDEPLQLARIRDVILGTDADLWGVQEVTSASAFTTLLSHLPGYAGLLANDSSVAGGPDSYSDGEIKVGLIFKTSVVEVTGARIILAELDHEFAGRPPLEMRVRFNHGNVANPAVVIVLHAKADQQVASWERRAAAAAGLKEYLDAELADEVVLVPGDWNDDVDESITSGRDTPYRPFVDAAPEWVFPTAELTATGVTSILGFDDVIDHILASNEIMPAYEPGSALVYRVDEYIPDYRDTTSDHLPVLVRFRTPN